MQQNRNQKFLNASDQIGRETNLECFDSDSEVVFLPDTYIDLAILASSKLVLHGDIGALHLPLVVDGRDPIDSGLVAFRGWVVQRCHQTVRYSGMMMDQLG